MESAIAINKMESLIVMHVGTDLILLKRLN